MFVRLKKKMFFKEILLEKWIPQHILEIKPNGDSEIWRFVHRCHVYNNLKRIEFLEKINFPAFCTNIGLPYGLDVMAGFYGFYIVGRSFKKQFPSQNFNALILVIFFFFFVFSTSFCLNCVYLVYLTLSAAIYRNLTVFYTYKHIYLLLYYVFRK